MSNLGRNIALWVIILLLLITLFKMFSTDTASRASRAVSYSEFMAQVEDGRVRDVVIEGRNVAGHLVGGRTFTTYTPDDPKMIETLRAHDVAISAKADRDGVSPIFAILLNWLPMILIIAVWIFFMRQMQGSSGKAMGFGKSRARQINHENLTCEKTLMR